MKRSTIGLLLAATTLGIATRLIAPTSSVEYDYEGNDDFGELVAVDHTGSIYVAASGNVKESSTMNENANILRHI